MTCPLCKTKSGQYDLQNCLGCAARLVKAARPSRTQQEKMLVYVTRWHSRSDVLHEITRSKS